MPVINIKAAPAGWNHAEILSVEFRDSSSGNPQLVVEVQLEAGVLMNAYLVVMENGPIGLSELLAACGAQFWELSRALYRKGPPPSFELDELVGRKLDVYIEEGLIRAYLPNPDTEQAMTTKRKIKSIYIAGPMTGIPEHNVPQFDRTRLILESLGYKVESPPDINQEYLDSIGKTREEAGIRPDGSINEEFYCLLCKLDIAAISRVDALVFLPGWEASKGAKREYVMATWAGMPCYDVRIFMVEGVDGPQLATDLVSVEYVGPED